MMAEKKKPKRQTAAILQDIKVLSVDDEKGKKELPNLTDCLMHRWFEGALVKEGGRISIRFDGPAILVSIDMPQEGYQTTIEVHSLASALAEAEKAITNNACTWRPSWKKQKEGRQRVDDII